MLTNSKKFACTDLSPFLYTRIVCRKIVKNHVYAMKAIIENSVKWGEYLDGENFDKAFVGTYFGFFNENITKKCELYENNRY